METWIGNQPRLHVSAPLTEVISTNPTELPLLTAPLAPPTMISEAPEQEEPEEKKSRCTQQTAEANTQDALLQIKEEFAPLPGDPVDRTTRSANSQPVDPQWQEIVVGVTKVLFSPIINMYQCTLCDFQRSTPLGVTSHYGKYCSKRHLQQAPTETIDVDE